MAQQGRNGHHEDNGADTASYIFNPMAYNYSQHHAFSPPTVLSQQDATLMADFFNNPDTSNADTTYMAYNMDANNNINTHNALTSDPAMTNAHAQQSHVNYNNHAMPQANRMPMNIYEYSSSFLQNNSHPQQSPNNHSAGDAVAGASALLGLSTSQEQANLLGANSYMTWPNIVGAHLQAPMNNNSSATSAVSPVRAPPMKSNSTSQLQTQLQPPATPAATTWADIQAQELHLRARHPSLQLDTSNTHFPSHQQSWQTAPQSAAPHVGRRPTMVKFGSDNHFSPHGFTGPALDQQEEKQNNLLHMATAGGTATGTPGAAQPQRPMSTMHHRHSITGGAPITSATHHSPIMVGGMAAPVQQLQATYNPPGLHAAHTIGNGTGRKRGFNEVDNNNTTPATDLAGHVNAMPDTSHQHNTSNGQAVNATAATTTQAAPAPATQPISSANTNSHTTSTARRRHTARSDPRPPRQNLTDAQKRQNHIASEQKRRDTMKTNYEILGHRVPAVRDGGAMSRSEILYHVANHLETLIAGNDVMANLAGLTWQQIDDMPDSEDESTEGGDD